MRKHVLIFLLLSLLSGFSFAYEQKSIDLVVVLDTSSSMYAHSHQVSDFVIGPLLKDFLRYGDSFHLISFSSSAKIEISRKIENIGDIETIMGRLLLLYPLDKYSDIIAALQYTSRYLTELPENRAKTVIFITDGDHNPSPTSPNKLEAAEALDAAIRESVSKLKGNGWVFHYIRVPQDLDFRATTIREAPSGKTTSGIAPATQPSAGTTAQSSSMANTNAADQQGATPSERKTGESIGTTKQEIGTQDVSTVVAQELNIPVTELNPEQEAEIISTTIGAISVEFPLSVGKVHRKFTLPLKVKNPSPNPVYLETQAVLVEGTDRMRKKSFKEIPPRSDSVLELYIGLPETYQNGATTLRIEPQFAGSIRINPPSAPIRADVVSDTMSSMLLSLFPVLLLIAGILIAAVFAVLIIILLRRLQKNPSYAMAEAIHTTREEPNKVTKPVPFKEKEQHAPPVPSKDTSTVDLMAEFARKKAEEKNKGPALPLQTRPDTLTSQQKAMVSTQSSSEIRQLTEDKKKSKVPVKMPSFSGALSVLQEDTGPTAITKPSLAIEPSISIRRANGRIMLSLFVQDQNTAIGKRNVHLMKAGHRLTLGGHNSDFLIFLVPIPHRIADVHFDGEELTLIPRRSEFFPDTGAEPIYNCVGKTIHLRSAKGYDLYIRFEKYQNPLDTLNNFLRSIEVSGTGRDQSAH